MKDTNDYTTPPWPIAAIGIAVTTILAAGVMG